LVLLGRAKWPVWCSTVRTYFTTVVMTANTDLVQALPSPPLSITEAVMLAVPPRSEIPLVQGLLVAFLLRKLKGCGQMLAEFIKSMEKERALGEFEVKRMGNLE
jgi:hypothetical protein